MRRLLATAVGLAALLVGLAAPKAEAAAGWHLRFADAFTTPVAKGGFRDCGHNADTPAAYCGGLSGSVRASWWAYPAGWPDTATQRHYPVGGLYDPASTLWIAPSPWGDGQLHIRMWRGASGPVHSATVVPKAAMGLRYGRYEIRERVSYVSPGYKSAQLLWPVSNDAGGCSEIDFPENSHNIPVSAFDHPSNCGQQDAIDTGARWSTWHTYVIEWTPGGVDFYVDATHVGHSSKTPGVAMDWDIQNESSLDGETAAPNSWDQIDVSWVKVWSWS